MSNIKLKSYNDFRNNKEYFINIFTECITEDFAHTYNQYITHDSPGATKIENIAYYKNYIDDFKNINDLRYLKDYFNLFIPEINNMIYSLNDLYLNIIEIFVSSYELEKDKLNIEISQYFNNLFNLKQYNLSLSLNKSSLDNIELIRTYNFIYETILNLHFQVNKNLYIDIEHTPLSYSFKKLLKSFKRKNNSGLRMKSKNQSKFTDFVCKIPSNRINDFEEDLVTQFVNYKGKKIAFLFNILQENDLISVSDGEHQAFHDSLTHTFKQNIGCYKNFMKYFKTDLSKEIVINNKNKPNPFMQEIKATKAKLNPIIERYIVK